VLARSGLIRVRSVINPPFNFLGAVQLLAASSSFYVSGARGI
jgi:hypothetical protein